MRRLQLCFQRKTLIVGTVIAVSGAYFPAARGQAIVTYGVGVGRAAGAGAAAGTGAAGIFDKLNKTTAKAAGHEAKGKPGLKTSPELAPKPASPNAITIGGDKSADAAENSSVVRTASGISIAGLTVPKPANGGIGNATAEAGNTPDSASPGQAANRLAEPDGFRLPEVPLPDPDPAASATQSPTEESAGMPKLSRARHDEIETPAAPPAKPAPASANLPVPLIAQGITSKAAPAPGAGATPLTITAGTPIQDVIKLLGQPLMRLSGVEGADHDERYVFLTASGSKLTILAQDGLVLRVISD